MKLSFVALPGLVLLLVACSTTQYRDYSKIVAVTGTDARVDRQTIRLRGLAVTIIPLNQTNRVAYMGLFVLPIPVAFLEKGPVGHAAFRIKLTAAPGTGHTFALDPSKVFLQWGSNEKRAPLGYEKADPPPSRTVQEWRGSQRHTKIPLTQPACLVLEFPTPTLEPSTPFSIAIEGLERDDQPLPMTTVKFERASGWRYIAHFGFKDFVLGSAGGDEDCRG